MSQSLAKTLAGKHKSTARKMFRRYKSTVQTEHGERACLQVVVQRGNGKHPLVARFCGIHLKRNRQAVLVDQTPTRNRFNPNPPMDPDGGREDSGRGGRELQAR